MSLNKIKADAIFHLKNSHVESILSMMRQADKDWVSVSYGEIPLRLYVLVLRQLVLKEHLRNQCCLWEEEVEHQRLLDKESEAIDLKEHYEDMEDFFLAVMDGQEEYQEKLDGARYEGPGLAEYYAQEYDETLRELALAYSVLNDRRYVSCMDRDDRGAAAEELRCQLYYLPPEYVSGWKRWSDLERRVEEHYLQLLTRSGPLKAADGLEEQKTSYVAAVTEMLGQLDLDLSLNGEPPHWNTDDVGGLLTSHAITRVGDEEAGDALETRTRCDTTIHVFQQERETGSGEEKAGDT
ncbi:hypothetical protein KIPB_000677 [Kipferlia bialata]|uniref:Uncharacterized protein n=1 Tax=Kipferlia bialata TaxID=797122 RepID=A0A9K3GEQ3_9EUKA|nr:hypothetical protein KIPB_000677 [Kipferlia bialata]|eukprot:g677.t1